MGRLHSPCYDVAPEHVMSSDPRSQIPEALQEAGGLEPGVARDLAAKTGIPEAEIHGVASFFHLLARPKQKVRVCTGLSCAMEGSLELLAKAEAAGLPVEGVSCLAGCDVPPAVLRDRRVLPRVEPGDIDAAKGDWTQLRSSNDDESKPWTSNIGSAGELALDLHAPIGPLGGAFAKAEALGVEGILQAIEDSGLQGRGGAGFPAHIKWRGVHGQEETMRYFVLNADEGEPGTFKDRELLVRRPDLVLEGMAIAAMAIGAREIYVYLRGEFEVPWGVLEEQIEKIHAEKIYGDLTFHLHAGHGAYICGEETALLEALEGKRGMPRLKPPFPVEFGLWGKPTLIHNVETIACVPSIIEKGGEWFRGLGRTEAGSKLYCVSGHVAKPGIYEMPLGVTLDELVECAGGYVGELKAFSPGGASSGFLPADKRDLPLDFGNLNEIGSMLGSAGVVVLNDTVDVRWAVEQQLRFFEDESCGQCAPCRIGTRYLRESLIGTLAPEGAPPGKEHLTHVADVAWQMNEGSICGLGQAAPLPLTSALRYFPEEFEP